MKRIFRYLLYLVICLVIIFGVGAAVFWKKIHEYWAVYEYAQVFKPDVIDENFRTLYKRYASIRIPHTNDVSSLPKLSGPCPRLMSTKVKRTNFLIS